MNGLPNLPRTLLGLGALVLALAGPVRAQTAEEAAAVEEWLQLDTRALEALSQGAQGQGKNVRWLTLNEKRQKLARTAELTAAKRRQSQLQRDELGALARRLSATLDLFTAYYEKYRVASSSVKSLAGLLQFSKRVGELTAAINGVYAQLGELAHLAPAERELFGRYLDGMVDRAARIVEGASLALIGEDTNAAELEALRAEHGEFFVLLATADRTRQLAALNDQLSVLSLDLQRLTTYLLFTTKNRQHAAQDPDAIRRLFHRD